MIRISIIIRQNMHQITSLLSPDILQVPMKLINYRVDYEPVVFFENENIILRWL